MEVKELITGLQHIGIPTADMEKTCAFFSQFGFEPDWRKEDGSMVFLKNGDLVLELYLADDPAGCDGAVNHIALHVEDIRKAYEYVTSLGYEALEGKICSNDAYGGGSVYFTIMGPDHERVEFARLN